ncbi:MAG: ATPase, T2SS/T4P/T4SS family, partial [Myxococcota bacterium]
RRRAPRRRPAARRAGRPSGTIRKPRAAKAKLEDLVAGGACSEEAAEAITRCVREKRNVIVAGGSALERIDALAAVASAIPAAERVVSIAHTGGPLLPQADWLRLEETGGRGGVALGELVRTAQRLRAERLIVAELRGEEALDVLLAMAGGQACAITSLHATAWRDAVARIEILALLAGRLPQAALRDLIAAARPVVVEVGARSLSTPFEVTAVDAATGRSHLI